MNTNELLHYKQLHPNPDFLGEADFIDKATGELREFVLVIKGIAQEELQLPGRSAKEQKIVLAFEKAKKRLVLNKTNAAAIKTHWGKWTKEWRGKSVTLYFDPTVKFGRETVGGVRIRGKQ